MSIRLMSAVRDLQLPPPEKFCLLAYADFANEEGGNAYPSRQKLVDYTCYSERTVVSAVRALEAKGYLRVTGSQGKGVLVYQLSLAMLGIAERPAKMPEKAAARGARAASQAKAGVQELQGRGAGAAPVGMQEIHPRGAGAVPNPLINHQVKPSVNLQEIPSSIGSSQQAERMEDGLEAVALFDKALEEKLERLGVWPDVARKLELKAAEDGWTLVQLHDLADRLIQDKGMGSAGQLFSYRIRNKIRPKTAKEKREKDLERFRSMFESEQISRGMPVKGRP